MVDKILENRKCVKTYDTEVKLERSLIEDLLRRTHKVTPSKNQFMPYKIHVLGPEHQDYKEAVFEYCLRNEAKNDDVAIEDLMARYKNPPNYACINTCSHLLIFTQRLEDQPSEFQQYLIDRGHNYEQVDESKLSRIVDSVSLEVGMFADTFSALCAENGIDTSFTLCFPKKVEKWKNLPFIKRRPLLLVSVGKGVLYRRDWAEQQGYAHLDRRPNFERIVNFVEDQEQPQPSDHATP